RFRGRMFTLACPGCQDGIGLHRKKRKRPRSRKIWETSAFVGLAWTVKWWSGGGSNSRPLHCERSALPAELPPHEGRGVYMAVARDAKRDVPAHVRIRSISASYSSGLRQPSSAA